MTETRKPKKKKSFLDEYGCALLMVSPFFLLCGLMMWLLLSGRITALLILIAVVVIIGVLLYLGFLRFADWYGKKKRGEI